MIFNHISLIGYLNSNFVEGEDLKNDLDLSCPIFLNEYSYHNVHLINTKFFE